MKNVLYLLIYFTTTITFAQTQIEKDFQGNWKLTEVSVNGSLINIEKSTIIFSKEIQAKMSAQEKASVEAKKEGFIKSIAKSQILVSANTINLIMGDLDKKGVYVIDKYKDAYKLAIAYNDGSAENLIIYIKSKKLYVSKTDDEKRDEMIFTHK